jgi:Uncharacterised nucleotidyltransferase
MGMSMAPDIGTDAMETGNAAVGIGTDTMGIGNAAVGIGAEPRPKVLHFTLRMITETLARELVRPSRSAPDWSEFEWSIARAVAAMHGISSLLLRSLTWQGPEDWQQFLEQQRIHIAKRHARFDDLLERVDRRSRAACIAVIALKGVALHEMGLYEPGERPMADIDLLVRPADADGMAGILESLGYREVKKTWKERAFDPVNESVYFGLGEHSNSSVKVELHERICERLPWRITDVSDSIFPLEPHSGLNAYPSKASLMIHLLLHATGSMAGQALRLLQLHDLMLLSSKMSHADWDQVLAVPSLWWAYPPLELTSRYYPSSVPDRVLAQLAGECTYLLRRTARCATLYDVSYSYLWVDAFPGIEWSQSFGDIVSYAARRAWPSGKHLELRASVAKSRGWDSQSQWAPMPQWRRILRWVISRPTRPLTMHAVRAALAQ